MIIGILGMPLTGKTTLFNLLTSQRKQTDTFLSPKTKNIGVVKIVDDRLDYLSSLHQDKKTIYATLEIVDIPGISADIPEKQKQEIFSQIQNTDALLIIIRVFQDEAVPGDNNPVQQLENLVYEIILRDLELIENRINRLAPDKRKLTIQEENEKRILTRCEQHLSENSLLVNLSLSEEELRILSGYDFFSLKPIIVVANLDEEQLHQNKFPEQERFYQLLREYQMACISISGKIEMEINELEDEEKTLFLEELGLKESGIQRLTHTLYQHLGLISFFTIGKDEIKAWTIRRGTTAVKAAGKVHSDIERGFIRAEIVDFNNFKDLGSMQKVKEKGLLKVEGKEYLIEDGNIVFFRFNV
jgi:GTP-binding protein YchF